MKTLRLVLVVIALTCAVAKADPEAPEITPTPPPALLEIYEAKIKGAAMNQMGYDVRHPLMVIREVREARLAKDKKGVLLVLTEDDAKALADMTRDFDGRPLIFKSVGDVIRPININGVVEDGKIGFKYPEAAAMAEEFRRYFHLGEFAAKTP